MLPVFLDCVCLVFLRLVCPMLPVSLRRGQTKQTQSRETGSMGHTRRRKTKQAQCRETGNIGHTRRRQIKQTQSRETGSFSTSCVPYAASFSGLCLLCLSTSCVPYVTNKANTIQRNWQHKAQKSRKTKQAQSRETGNIGHTIRRKTK
jgi:hypothetical protein